MPLASTSALPFEVSATLAGCAVWAALGEAANKTLPKRAAKPMDLIMEVLLKRGRSARREPHGGTDERRRRPMVYSTASCFCWTC